MRNTDRKLEQENKREQDNHRGNSIIIGIRYIRISKRISGNNKID